jgi:hypothetical protein
VLGLAGLAACGSDERRSSTSPTAIASVAQVTSPSRTADVGATATGETRGENARLDAAKMTLEVFYPITAPVWATVHGAPGAAPNGVKISCRSRDKAGHILGTTNVSTIDGAFQMTLDASVFPRTIRDLSETGRVRGKVECRAGEGPWVQPGETLVGME